MRTRRPEIAKVAQGNAVRVGRAEQGPDAGADDGGDRDALLFEDFQNTQVREAPGEAATQGQGDPRCRSQQPRFCAIAVRGCRLTIEVWLGTTRGRHAASLARWYGGGNEAEVPDFRYSRYLVPARPRNLCRNG